MFFPVVLIINNKLIREKLILEKKKRNYEMIYFNWKKRNIK